MHETVFGSVWEASAITPSPQQCAPAFLFKLLYKRGAEKSESTNCNVALKVRLGAQWLLKDWLCILHMTSWFQLRHCRSFCGLNPLWRQGLVPSLTHELSEILSAFNYNVTGLPVFPRNTATYPRKAPEFKRVHVQFLYFHPTIFVPFLHHIKQFLMTAILHIITSYLHKHLHVNCFYPLKFTSLTIDGQNPPLKTLPTLSLVQTVSANSRQSSPISVGCSPQTFQTLQLFWGVLTLDKNWASYGNRLGVLGPNIVYSNCFAQSFVQRQRINLRRSFNVRSTTFPTERRISFSALPRH